MPPKTSKPSPPSTAEDSNSPIYFWREYSSPHSYLSQWYSSPFTSPLTDITYTTAEQYMMHQKAILFSDLIIASKILASTDPKEQKALGRQVENFDDVVWKAERERIVKEASRWKFSGGSDEGELKEEGKSLRERLLQTGQRELFEASPRDRIWGIGFGEKNASKRRGDWGLNLLGKALMHAREKLREEEGGVKEDKPDVVEADVPAEVEEPGRNKKRRKIFKE